MSTIKSSDEHLTLNADGSGNDIKFQSNGTEVASISDGGVITATTFSGAATDSTKLPLAGGTMTGNLDLGDSSGAGNNRLRFGAGNDLEIYHNGNDSYIKDDGDGDLIIRAGDDLRLQDSSGDAYITCNDNDSVEVYHNGSKKFETTSSGVEVTGQLEGGEGYIKLSGIGDYIAHFISDTNNSAHRGIVIQNGSDNGYGNNYHIIFRDGDGGEAGAISHNSGTTTYASPSDYRLKENVADMTDATTRLKQLKPKRFNFIKDETNTPKDGFLAHEVSSVVPEAVIGAKDAEDSEGNPDYQGLDESKLVPLLVKTIQELEARITALEG